MGVVMVVIFISAVLLLCGLVLLTSGADNSSRRAGFYLLAIGLVGIFISAVSYPRDRPYVPFYEYSNDAPNYDK